MYKFEPFGGRKCEQPGCSKPLYNQLDKLCRAHDERRRRYGSASVYPKRGRPRKLKEPE
jgi:hypothetical protein